MGGCKRPGPLCQQSNPIDLDEGTLVRHRSPNAGPIGLSQYVLNQAATPIDTLVFDQDQVISFLESVAHAKVAERHTRLIWKDYNESTVLNIIYSILPYGKPGIAEVDAGDIHKVLAETQQETKRLLEEFAVAASRGAARSVNFLKAQEQIRQNCLETVRDTYRDVANLNEDMRNEARRGIARLTLIKTASTITLKATALSVGGLPAFLVGTGYDVTLKLIQDWDRAAEAKLVGITSKVTDKLWKKGVKDAAKNRAYILKQEGSTPAHKAEWLEKRLAAMEEELERQASAERLKKFARDGRRLSRAQQEAARSKWGSRAFSSVKFVFFAWDVYNAAQDARNTFESAGYSGSWEAIKDAAP